MAIDSLEFLWLTQDHQLSMAELTELSGLTETDLRELVDYGAITPLDPGASHWMFAATSLATVRAACRLQSSFELAPHGVALVLSLLERIATLEAQVRALRARTPRHAG